MTVENTIREDTAERHRHKYQNTNLIHRLFLGRFLDAMAAELMPLTNGRALEFGCGEGYLLKELSHRGVRFAALTGIDLREDALVEARAQVPEYEFLKADLLTFTPKEGAYDLVFASQVLEHLPDPGTFLEALVKLAKGPLVLTVPHEPWFRLVNLARGRDIRRLGNHPEHVNLWGEKAFRTFVEKYAVIDKIYTVFPFIIVAAHPR